MKTLSGLQRCLNLSVLRFLVLSRRASLTVCFAIASLVFFERSPPLGITLGVKSLAIISCEAMSKPPHLRLSCLEVELSLLTQAFLLVHNMEVMPKVLRCRIPHSKLLIVKTEWVITFFNENFVMKLPKRLCVFLMKLLKNLLTIQFCKLCIYKD